MTDLTEHCERAAKIVSTWPEWKHGLLGASGTNSTARKPVHNDNLVESALRAEIAELRGFIRSLTETLRDIAAWLDCGCKPCTGQCRCREALEIELEARMELAREAVARVEKYL